MGTHESSFGAILTPIIYNKLPSEVRKNITRDRGNDDWDLNSLRTAIQREVCVQLAGNPSSAYPEVNPEVDFTASFLAGTSGKNGRKWSKGGNQPKIKQTRDKVCLFCEDSHHPNTCNKVTNLNERMDIVKKKSVCFNCFGNHRVSRCNSKSSCLKCGKRHHTSICNRNEIRQNSEIPRYNSAAKDAVVHANVTDTGSPPAVFHTKQEKQSEVLLKTAVAPIWNNGECVMTNILLDEGAQRSFISEDLARKLDITPNGSATTTISGFGGSDNKVRRLDRATIWLETENCEKTQIDVIVVPKIAAPIQTKDRAQVSNLPYIRGLRLAHPVSNEERFNISLLIGAYFYWSIVEDQIIRGKGTDGGQVEAWLSFIGTDDIDRICG